MFELLSLAAGLFDGLFELSVYVLIIGIAVTQSADDLPTFPRRTYYVACVFSACWIVMRIAHAAVTRV